MSGSLANLVKFGPMEQGDSDVFYMDISTWSISRNNEYPTSAVTVAVQGEGLTATEPAYIAGAPFAVGALSVRLIGGLPGRTYLIVFTFTTNLGNTISRTALLSVVDYLS